MNCCQKHTIRSDEDKKTLTTRLNKIEGQIRGIKTMVEDDRYCDDILIQLSAIDKSIKSLANLFLEKHLKTCVKNQILAGDENILDEVISLIKRFQ